MNIKLSLALLLASQMLFAQGVRFDKNSAWDSLLVKAEVEKKMIFLDAYTTWCGPCKKMDRDVFPQEEIGRYYNEKFINIKMDMEKGEGVAIAKRYNITAFPTFLFVDGSGTMVHRAAGYIPPQQFLDLGKTVMIPGLTLSAQKKRYEVEGDRDPAFLKKYTATRFELADGSHVGIAEAYLETQEDWKTDENLTFILNYVDNPASPVFKFIVQNRQAFYRVYEQKEVDQRIELLVYNRIYHGETKPTIDQIHGIFKEAFPERADLLFANFKMSYYRQAGDRANYALATIDRFKQFPSKDVGELNDAAWTFYRVVEDRKQLKKAVKWSKKAIKISNEAVTNDTLAALYLKLKKKKKAIKYAKRAIALAKADGEDYSQTQSILEEAMQL